MSNYVSAVTFLLHGSFWLSKPSIALVGFVLLLFAETFYLVESQFETGSDCFFGLAKIE